MKTLTTIGFSLSTISLLFGLYLMFIIVPDGHAAEAMMTHIQNTTDMSTSLFEVPGYMEAFATMEKPVDYGSILLFVSMVPFLMCLYPAIKKKGLGILGVVFSLGAFFIAAAYGTHMFS